MLFPQKPSLAVLLYSESSGYKAKPVMNGDWLRH
jgi:hypothetical protein